MLTVKWGVCGDDGHWCSFENLNLTGNIKNISGVYIIWHGGDQPRVVRVGQGDVADRIRAHRKDPEITKYARHGMFVTWASVPANQQNGVERYLADRWNPLVGDAFPVAAPIAVNSPW